MRFFSLQTDSKTKKFFMAALLFSLFIVVLYCYFWVKILQKNEDVAVLLGEVEVLAAEKESLTSIKEKVAETEEARGKLSGFFISKDGVVSFLNKIQALGAENRLEFKVDSVEIEDEKSAPDIFENVKLNIDV